MTSTEVHADEVEREEGAPASAVVAEDDRYPVAERAREVAERLVAARAAGFTRPELREASGFTPAQLWRMEQGRVHADELDRVDELLRRIADGALKPAGRPASGGGGRASLRAERDAAVRVVESVRALLTATLLGPGDKPATRAQLEAGVREALETLEGDLEEPEAPAEKSDVEEPVEGSDDA